MCHSYPHVPQTSHPPTEEYHSRTNSSDGRIGEGAKIIASQGANRLSRIGECISHVMSTVSRHRKIPFSPRARRRDRLFYIKLPFSTSHSRRLRPNLFLYTRSFSFFFLSQTLFFLLRLFIFLRLSGYPDVLCMRSTVHCEKVLTTSGEYTANGMGCTAPKILAPGWVLPHRETYVPRT